MDAALTEEEIGFLQELVDAEEVGRTITGLKSRAGLLRLVQLKYVTEQSTSLIQFSIASPMLAGMHSPKSDNAVNLSPQQRSRLVVQERGYICRSAGFAHPDFDPPALAHVASCIPVGEPAVGIDELRSRERQNTESPQSRIG